ncbi:MAG: hypothetical protein ABIY90_12545 [Puia sp.]
MKKDLSWLSASCLLLSVLLIAFNTRQLENNPAGKETRTAVHQKKQKTVCCESNIPSRFRSAGTANALLILPRTGQRTRRQGTPRPIPSMRA